MRNGPLKQAPRITFKCSELKHLQTLQRESRWIPFCWSKYLQPALFHQYFVTKVLHVLLRTGPHPRRNGPGCGGELGMLG